ncbi:hypothetical protein Btru_072821 [Bulinus truncatus]|nr:hypothetical protein Btru_072821 [Bulinus truncatus]
MTSRHVIILACFILSCYAQNGPYCPPVEFSFLLDQSETARFAASDEPKNDLTKFNILEDQLKNVFNNSVLLRSPDVSISAVSYSGGATQQIIPQGTKPEFASNTLYLLRNIPNSGSWTSTGLKNITSPPTKTANVLFLITAQGSTTSSKRALTLSDLPRFLALNWNVTIFAMVSNLQFDTAELQNISSKFTVLNDTFSSDPKSYRLLSYEVNKIINSICNLYPTAATTTTTTTTTSTTTTRPTTTTTTTTVAPRVASEICSQCLYEGGFGFDDDADYCDTFYQCIPNSKPIKKLCPAGTFWDGNQCNFIDAVKCVKAVCNANTQNSTYPSGKCCNKFYECYNGKLYERQCTVDQYYDATNRRCQSANRTVVCELTGRFECDVNRNLNQTFCNGYANDPFGDPCKYQFNNVSLRVAPGTVWSQRVCSLVADVNKACSVPVVDKAFEPTNSTCNANFLATYNSGSKTVISERAGTNIDIYSTQQEVQLSNNALTFTSNMISPYFYYFFFNNKDMDVNTAFRVRFNLQNAVIGKTYDILSNSYCSLCPDTIRFTVSQSGTNSYVVTATFVTTERVAVETSAVISNVNPSNFLEMTVIFGDTSVYGKLYELTSTNTLVKTSDFVVKAKTSGVHIAINKCGIQLGRGPNNHFVGTIDEFAVYEKCKNIEQTLRS